MPISVTKNPFRQPTANPATSAARTATGQPNPACITKPQVSAAKAADIFGEGQRQQARLHPFVIKRIRKLLFALQRAHEIRWRMARHELLHAVAQEFLLFGETEIHALASLMMCRVSARR